MMLTTQLHVVPKLRMSRALLLPVYGMKGNLPLYGQGQVTFHFIGEM